METVFKRAAIFYSSTILISWSLWIGTIVISQRSGVDIFYNEGFYTMLTGGSKSLQQWLSFLFFTAAAYGPLVGVFAVALLLRTRNKETILHSIEPIKQTKFGHWLLFIFLYPIILFSAALVVTWIAMGFNLKLVLPVLPFWFLPVYFLFQCVTSGIEEFGWRGYLQPLLQSRFTAEKACFRVGLLWSIWHYPIIIYMNHSLGVAVVLLTLFGFTMLTIPQAYVIGWLYNSTRNILLCVVLHAWANTVSAYILAASPVPLLTPIAVAIGTWLFANHLVKKYGKETLSTQSRWEPLKKEKTLLSSVFSLFFYLIPLKIICRFFFLTNLRKGFR